METRTISEKLFENLCRSRCVECVRIPETTHMTADYRLSLGSLDFITEVKQLDPNDNDEKLAKSWSNPNSPPVPAPSERVKSLLKRGYPQVKRLSDGKLPTMIVVYNNSEIWNWIDTFTVTKAMFGACGIVLRFLPNQTVSVIGQGFFGKRSITKDMCRSLSVVGVLEHDHANELTLDCYHNPFAHVTAEPKMLAKLADNQYMHPNPHDRGFISWEPIMIQV